MGKHDNELLEASRNGDYLVVEKILREKKSKKSAFHSLRRSNAGINTVDSSGYNALHHASLNGHTEVVQLLLSHDEINPNSLDSRGASPLHLAAWAGHSEICKFLLTHPTLPADPNLQASERETPLHFAAQHGHVNALMVLLAHGADPNIMNERGETPLDLGAQYGRLQIITILIRADNEILLPLKATSTGFNHSALHLASRNGHHRVVEVLLAAGVNVNLLTKNGSALHEAALYGKDKVVRILLRESINLDATNSDGQTVFDLLDEFPPHVTTRIMNVINQHRNSSIYDSESDDYKSFGIRGSNSNHRSQQNNSQNRNNHRYQDHYEQQGGTTSPSSSMGSFCGIPSPTPHGAGTFVPIKPNGSHQSLKAAPMKPPRRTLSTSPPNHQPQQLSTMSQSFDYSQHHNSNDQLDCSSSTSSNHQYNTKEKPNTTNTKQQRSAYEYLYFAESGHLKTVTDINKTDGSGCETGDGNGSEYIMMKTPFSLPTVVNVENREIRVANPNRKLRRPRNDGYTDNNNDTNTYIQIRRNPNEPPLSPTHYQQPGTPEHAPPSAAQAERYIHERIRPLSQEYKRCSGKLDWNKSPASASSGSLSSVSLSSSTDCVEEYHGDIPFAGLFKGSTMTLNNPNTFNSQVTTFTQLNSKQQRHHPTISSSVQQEDSQIGTTTNNNNNNNNNSQSQAEKNLNVMSPFDEQEEWAKISEIMASFGSGIARESVFVNDIENEFKTRLGLKNAAEMSAELSSPTIDESIPPLKRWLIEIKMEHLEEYLLENGYDNVDYLNGLIMNENDIELIGVPEKDRQLLLKEIVKLPKAPTIMEANKHNKLNNNQHAGILTVDHWLASIQLEDYIDVFKRHLYVDMEKVYRVWEIELQAVLDINKIGHRKRILHSLVGQRLEPPNIEEINDETSSNHTASDQVQIDSIDNNNVDVVKSSSSPVKISTAKPTTLSRHKKSRPAPQPPVRANNLEIRAPSELLLSSHGGLNAQWRHSAAALVSGSIKYEVFYLGSTIIKELRGTESTRKSIQKLKRGERIAASSITSPSANPSAQKLFQSSKRPVCLAISHLGVQFIDIESQGTFCEHSVRNIDCACQDADDLSHFAYITKDFENNTHYCHVFNVESMDLATEIILTLGQAFEVAYQLALRETSSSSTPSSSGCGKRPMSVASTTSTDIG